MEGEGLFIGDEKVLNVPGIRDGKVICAIRPEGFLLDETGPFTLNLERMEVMGRDTSVVCNHEDGVSEVIRAIVRTDSVVDEDKETVRFTLIPSKVHLFDPETEEDLPFMA